MVRWLLCLSCIWVFLGILLFCVRGILCICMFMFMGRSCRWRSFLVLRCVLLCRF